MKFSSAALGLFVAALVTLDFCTQAIGKDNEYPSLGIDRTLSGYDAAILRDGPALFLNLGNRGERPPVRGR
jgi:hypothetical protein